MQVQSETSWWRCTSSSLFWQWSIDLIRIRNVTEPNFHIFTRLLFWTIWVHGSPSWVCGCQGRREQRAKVTTSFWSAIFLCIIIIIIITSLNFKLRKCQRSRKRAQGRSPELQEPEGPVRPESLVSLKREPTRFVRSLTSSFVVS